ncbi:MAG: hypothetical protein HZA00_02010 [Nitrospinae bacterium]|nr:hypothetical protein [Nitrospinota bacterium]
MDNFHADRDINVHGNVNISHRDQNIYKPLAYSANEELFAERRHKQGLLQKEEQRKNKVAFRFIKTALAVLVVLAVWYFIQGSVTLSMFLIGFVGVFVPFVIAMQTMQQQTEFEVRQLAILKEISILLRERGVE